jgi:hypothetical protein
MPYSSRQFNPIITPGTFTAQKDKLNHSRQLIISGQYTEAREILESLPFSDEAKTMLRDLEQLERQSRQRLYSSHQAGVQQGVSIKIAMALLIIGLLTGAVGGFFFGRELLVREVTYALSSAFGDYSPTLEPFTWP